MNSSNLAKPLLCVFAIALVTTGCRAKMAPTGSKPPAYRQVTAADGLDCGCRTSEMSFEYLRDDAGQIQLVPSGTLINFHCTDKFGIDEDLELSSHQMVNGVIETKMFGPIHVNGGPIQGQEGHIYLTDDQIQRMKSYLNR